MSKPPLPPAQGPVDIPPIPWLGTIGAPRKPRPAAPVYDLATMLRCRAANAASLAQALGEEAEMWATLAREADPDHPWTLDDPHMTPSGEHLPEGWMDIADRPLPDEVA